jgi:hypothetical protein
MDLRLPQSGNHFLFIGHSFLLNLMLWVRAITNRREFVKRATSFWVVESSDLSLLIIFSDSSSFSHSSIW